MPTKQLAARRSIKISLVLSLASLNLAAFTQSKADSLLSGYSEKYKQEKISLIRDKEQYISGETIFAKGFVFTGYELSDISSNLFIEILDKRKKIISQSISPIYKGVSETSLKLPDSLSTGVYYLRAYTKRMLNFDERFQYLKPVIIYNPKEHYAIVADTSQWSFTAMPEAGKLIDGVPSKIVIRFLGSKININSITGTLSDKTSNSVLASFHPLDHNVALCKLTPAFGHIYEIRLTDSSKRVQTRVLPNVSASGVAMSMEQTDTTLTYTINFKNIPQNQTFRLIGTNNFDIVYKAKISSVDTIFRRTFTTKNMAKGVVRFSLFDDSFNLKAERLCFLTPDKPSAPQLNILKKNLTPRGENELAVKLDSNTICFIAAIDEGTDDVSHVDLISSLWLTSDFIDEIKSPSEYFHNVTNNKKEAIDALMMSEKWRRFDWGQLLSGNLPDTPFPDDNYLSYNGQILYKNKPVENASANLMFYFADSSRQLFQIKTDKTGHFQLNGLIFEGAASVTCYSGDKKFDNKLLKLTLTRDSGEKHYLSPLPQNNYITTTLDERLSGQILRSVQTLKNVAMAHDKSKQLQEVIVRAKAKSATQELDERLSSGRFYNPRETIYDFVNKDQKTGASTVAQWIRGRVPGDEKSFSYFVNEFQVQKTDLDIPVSDVAMIKVQGKGASHQIFIYLKTGAALQSAGYSTKAGSIAVAGYEKQNYPFEAPALTHNEETLGTDIRSLLLWSDFMLTEGETAIEHIKFTNNDHPKKIKISVIGLSNSIPFSFHRILL